MTQAAMAPNQIGQDSFELELTQRRAELHELLQECLTCQEEVEPNWQFCAYCGTRLATQCPRCGVPLPPAGAASCPNCGLAMPQMSA